jgi:hypothetical protein
MGEERAPAVTLDPFAVISNEPFKRVAAHLSQLRSVAPCGTMLI